MILKEQEHIKSVFAIRKKTQRNSRPPNFAEHFADEGLNNDGFNESLVADNIANPTSQTPSTHTAHCAIYTNTAESNDTATDSDNDSARLLSLFS